MHGRHHGHYDHGYHSSFSYGHCHPHYYDPYCAPFAVGAAGAIGLAAGAIIGSSYNPRPCPQVVYATPPYQPAPQVIVVQQPQYQQGYPSRNGMFAQQSGTSTSASPQSGYYVTYTP